MIIDFAGLDVVEEVPLEIDSFNHNIFTIQSIQQEHVDGNHTYVQTLVSAGYSEEQCITAVIKFGTLDAAKEFLDHYEEEEKQKGLRKSPSPIGGDKIQ